MGRINLAKGRGKGRGLFGVQPWENGLKDGPWWKIGWKRKKKRKRLKSEDRQKTQGKEKELSAVVSKSVGAGKAKTERAQEGEKLC